MTYEDNKIMNNKNINLVNHIVKDDISPWFEDAMFKS